MNAMTEITPATTTSHFVETHLGRLHVAQAGTGEEVIVLWPSIFTDHHIYDDLVCQLGHSYRFMLVDGPAHGQSDGTSSEFTMQDCADALDVILDHFGIEQAVVGGTSWGGIVAAHLALSHGSRVKKLILINTPMEINREKPGLKARMIAAGARWMLKSALFRNGVADSFFTPSVFAANARLSESFHSMLKAANPKSLAAAIRSVILRGSPLIERLPEISVPTLVIAGKEDSMYPISVQANAALLLEKGKFVAVDGKHISVVEQPEATAQAITDFLKHGVSQ